MEVFGWEGCVVVGFCVWCGVVFGFDGGGYGFESLLEGGVVKRGNRVVWVGGLWGFYVGMGVVGWWGVVEFCYDVEGDEMGVYNVINCNINDGR